MRAMHLAAILAAALVALACLGILLSPAGRRLLLDRPNERSLHRQPVPRSGGLAIAAGVGAAVAFSPLPFALWVALGAALALAAISLLDDILTLSTQLRLAAHLGAAAATVALAIGSDGAISFVLLALELAWSANLYNFMDGADGLAGGMALFGFGAYAVAGRLAGDPALASLCAVIAISSCVFLAANFPPAKIFMGDVGSVPLGFLAGALGLLGWRSGAWPLWFPMLVFAPFACDATLTLVKRLARRERVWQAHREHYYQRLVRMGFDHRGTLWIEYAAMAACAATALAIREASPTAQMTALVTVTLILAALAAWIDARWSRWTRRNGPGGAAA